MNWLTVSVTTLSIHLAGPCGARGRCRINPPRFLAECRKMRLKQGSFVLLYVWLFVFFDLYCAYVCIFMISMQFSFPYCLFVSNSCDWLSRPPLK